MDNVLPVLSFKSEILKSVKSNQVTIIKADTGAGKSTQVPHFLLAAGYKVLITQPRRLSAIALAKRVAEEHGSQLGTIIGYHVAGDRAAQSSTKCLFVTDGLALVTEVLNAKEWQTDKVIVLDEVHEWNNNIELLIAWVKDKVQVDPSLKVVIMSATLEQAKLSTFFDQAPVIDIPGQVYSIQTLAPSESIVVDIKMLVEQNKNVLVFLPGKSEIFNMINALEQSTLQVEIIPLHSEVSTQGQALAFASYDMPKVILATNIAETSITIPDIDAVIDSGLERRIQVVDGVEGLYLGSISKANKMQRRGRVGRTKPGIYIEHRSGLLGEELDFPIPEIHRSLLDQMVLRLASIGLDMERLNFFHQPRKSDIKEAKNILQSLGCMDKNGQVTQTGQVVATLPVSARLGRMIVEAQKYSCVKETISNVAIMEVGGVALLKDDKGNPCNIWRDNVRGEVQSDIFAQSTLLKSTKGKDTRKWAMLGVDEKKVARVLRVREQISKAVEASSIIFSKGGSRESQLEVLRVGLSDHIYTKAGKYYINGDGIKRQISNRSIVQATEKLIAQPFDVGEIDSFGNTKVIHFLQMVSQVGYTTATK